MYAQYGIRGFQIVENYIDSGGPVAQAVMDSGGRSQAFASNPYPGPTATAYPGLVALVLGVTPPGYPFFVSASHPTQPEQVTGDPAGIFKLAATAADGKASGRARIGQPGGPETADIIGATSDVASVDGIVTATARSVTEAVTLGPLALGRVRSESVTTYRTRDETPVTRTSLVIEGGRVGDTSFAFGREGLAVAQQGIPLPAGQGLAAINQALAPAGLSIAFGPEVPLEGGAAAGALEITNVADMPGAGKGTLRIRFGGAASFVALGADPTAPILSEDEGSTAGTTAEAAQPASPSPADLGSGNPMAPGVASLQGGADLETPGTESAGGFDAAIAPGDAGGGGDHGQGGAAPAEASPPAATANARLVALPVTPAVRAAGSDAVSVFAAVVLASVVGGLLLLGLRFTRRPSLWSS
jgi:hypothetical protein